MSADDPIDEAKDRETFAWLYRNCILPMARLTVRTLLAGNDTGCFTTEQYRVAYNRVVSERLKATDKLLMDAVVARRHLTDSGLVREAEPDVWAAK